MSDPKPTAPAANGSTEFRLAKPALRIAPSLLAADFAKLRDEVAEVEQAGADLLHLDVMDGHFVPNISFGPALIKKLRPHSKLFFDAHLMISEPAKYVEPFTDAGCDHITFHIEVVDEPEKVIEQIRNAGVSVGICINPSTPVASIRNILAKVDMVLVMSVWPGFGGQSFIPDVIPKVEQLRDLLAEHQRLEMDGGIDNTTITKAVRAGADTLVAGSAVFGVPDRARAIAQLRATGRAAAESGGGSVGL